MRELELWQLRQRQSLPLEVKIQMSLFKIRQWYEAWDGNVYVSFSGGKDSTVLLHLVRSLYPGVPAVFCDTGLEYPEIKDFVKTIDNVIWIKPNFSFRQVIEKYGYPVISKQVAKNAKEWRTNPTGTNARKILGTFKNKDGEKSIYCCDKYKYLLSAPFDISDSCCEVLKKRPFNVYEKGTQRKPFIGTMAGESRQRETVYLANGCNSFDSKKPKSQPLSYWNEKDIWEYIKIQKIKYSSIYDTGLDRTGCMFCMFGVHLEKEPNRFQRMERTHPQLHNYCMKNWAEGGLGLSKVLDYINVPYKDYVPQLKDYEQIRI